MTLLPILFFAGMIVYTVTQAIGKRLVLAVSMGVS
jgi:hypothetical protein